MVTIKVISTYLFRFIIYKKLDAKVIKHLRKRCTVTSENLDLGHEELEDSTKVKSNMTLAKFRYFGAIFSIQLLGTLVSCNGSLLPPISGPTTSERGNT